jgi:hypothetical protein
MVVRISRGGQIFGPYGEADVRRYLATGNILATDLAQAEGAEEWVPVFEIFPESVLAPGLPPGYVSGPPVLYPDPPDLPWWVVVILFFVTGSIFTVIWSAVQAAWLYRIDRTSKAIWWYLAWAIAFFVKLPNAYRMVYYNILGGEVAPPHGIPHLGLIGFALAIIARFVFRAELLEHFNVSEPIGLRLNGFWTFLFGSVYFQYHFNRINELKRALRVSVPTL